MKLLRYISLVTFLSFAFVLTAQAEEESESGLALPRMVSLRSSLINARSGPGSRYPIEWVYKQKGAPVEIIAEFELWRKIKDWEGTESWVHKAMLSGRRFVKVVNAGENNMIEVMCCEGGCIAGPGTVAMPKRAALQVENYVK